jgi:DNA-binding SARP family transcriptional activator
VEQSSPARLYLLGGFRLQTREGREMTPTSAKARALIAYLALSPGGRCDRAKAAGLLWSESASAKTSLRQSIKDIRASLASAGLKIFSADKYQISLDLGSLWVDSLEINRLARSPERPDLEQLIALYAGDLLEGVPVRDPEFEAWLLVERTRLRQQVCGTLEKELTRDLHQQDFERVKRVAEALLALEPAHESTHRALMRLYNSRGDLTAAIRQYQACRDALARELDVEPSAETEALLDELRSRAPHRQIARASPPVPAVASRRAPHALIAVEPKALALGDFVDQSLAAAVAASLREALSRIRWLSVVDASLYIPTLLGEGQQLAEPRYCVYVSVLRARERMRVAAELKDAETARILWADRYDRTLGEDVFGIIDTIAAALAGKLDQEVLLAETMRASRQPLETLSAYDCVLRAIPLIFKMTLESFAEAEKLLLKAQEADPHDALAYAWRAFRYFLAIGQSWAPDLQTAKAELDWLVHSAIESDPKDAMARAVAGHVASFVHHDYSLALSHFDESLKLDPNSAFAWGLSSITYCYIGKPDQAVRRLNRYRQLWPDDPYPYWFRTTACIAHLLAGKYNQAAELGRKTARENPNFQAAYRPLIASLGHIGQLEEADRYLKTLLRMEPAFSIAWFLENYPPLEREQGVRYIEGLRKAGVPES